MNLVLIILYLLIVYGILVVSVTLIESLKARWQNTSLFIKSLVILSPFLCIPLIISVKVWGVLIGISLVGLLFNIFVRYQSDSD